MRARRRDDISQNRVERGQREDLVRRDLRRLAQRRLGVLFEEFEGRDARGHVQKRLELACAVISNWVGISPSPNFDSMFRAPPLHAAHKETAP